MRQSKLPIAALLGASVMLAGCGPTRYRISPSDETVIMVGSSSTASVTGKFDQSETLVHWPPSYMWGEHPLLYGTDVVSRVAPNRPVRNVRVRVEPNGLVGNLKGWGAWLAGGIAGISYVASVFRTTQDGGQRFAAVAFAMPVIWGVVQASLGILVPDIYAVSVDGEFVEAPANIGQGGGK